MIDVKRKALIAISLMLLIIALIACQRIVPSKKETSIIGPSPDALGKELGDVANIEKDLNIDAVDDTDPVLSELDKELSDVASIEKELGDVANIEKDLNIDAVDDTDDLLSEIQNI